MKNLMFGWRKKIQKELDRIERDKIAEKERIKADIDRLNKQLERL